MKLKRKFIIANTYMFILSFLIFPVMTYVYGMTFGEMIRNGVISLLYSLGFTYLNYYCVHYGKLDYDNSEHPYRFMIIYLISLFLSVIFPLIDRKAWFFLLIAISILLFSNAFIAFYSVSGLILFTICLSSENDIKACFVYLFSAYIGILLFMEIDKSFKVSSSIIMAVLIQFVLEIAGFVMLENVELKADQFILPIINIAINFLTLTFILKYFNQVVANRYRDRYQVINDQEYKALIALKEVSKHEYYRSIHTAYLAERMANAINADVDAAKNCAYYHRIKKAFTLSNEDCESFVLDNEFPPKAQTLLLDFLNKNSKLVSKEAGIVFISDKVISTLMSIFEKDNKMKIDYVSFFDTLFEKDFFKDALSDSDLSQRDFKLIKEILLKETLYYDFLR